jgi:hypothetical protein
VNRAAAALLYRACNTEADLRYDAGHYSMQANLHRIADEVERFALESGALQDVDPFA